MGASALLAVLMIGEIVHMNGVFDDVKDIMLQINGPNFYGSVGFGMYLATVSPRSPWRWRPAATSWPRSRRGDAELSRRHLHQIEQPHHPVRTGTTHGEKPSQ